MCSTNLWKTYGKSPYTYMPVEARHISEVVESPTLPYASRLDLILFRINVLTLQSKKRDSDIQWISDMLEQIHPRGPISLLQQQRKDMEVAFEWFLEDQPMEKRDFWRRELGFRPRATQTKA